MKTLTKTHGKNILIAIIIFQISLLLVYSLKLNSNDISSSKENTKKGTDVKADNNQKKLKSKLKKINRKKLTKEQLLPLE